MTTLKTFHPDYALFNSIQIKCRDLYEGEDHIKSKGEVYLPATSGMKLDGMGVGQTGLSDYESYKLRSLLPGDFEDAVNSRIGLMHPKPDSALIELPAQLEYLLEDADGKGMPLEALLIFINLMQLIVGRVGLALDTTVDRTLKIAVYEAETIFNWDESDSGLQFVILDESGYKLDPDTFEWDRTEVYRLMKLQNGIYTTVTEIDGTMQAEIIPQMAGKPFKEIPFVFVNITDNKPTPQKPPLTSLANLALAIYRGEADYRQNLFMQGQDTLVIAGDMKSTQINPAGVAVGTAQDAAVRVGTGSKINVTAESRVEYVGVNSQGLPEQRLALEADRKLAQSKGGELVNTASTGVESNEALQTRIASRTVTLNHIALTGARGLETILKMAARWTGVDDTKIVVTPNMDFNKKVLSPDDLKTLSEVKLLGVPITKKALHAASGEAGLPIGTFEEDVAEVAQEAANG